MKKVAWKKEKDILYNLLTLIKRKPLNTTKKQLAMKMI